MFRQFYPAFDVLRFRIKPISMKFDVDITGSHGLDLKLYFQNKDERGSRMADELPQFFVSIFPVLDVRGSSNEGQPCNQD